MTFVVSVRLVVFTTTLIMMLPLVSACFVVWVIEYDHDVLLVVYFRSPNHCDSIFGVSVTGTTRSYQW